MKTTYKSTVELIDSMGNDLTVLNAAKVVYSPDTWVILKITSPTETYYKVLAGWFGGYLNGDNWRVNSGITKIVNHKTHYNIYGNSGSIYTCPKHTERLQNITNGKYEAMKKSGEAHNYQVEIVPIKQVLKMFKEKKDDL